jgi:fluoride exporter
VLSQHLATTSPSLSGPRPRIPRENIQVDTPYLIFSTRSTSVLFIGGFEPPEPRIKKWSGFPPTLNQNHYFWLHVGDNDRSFAFLAFPFTLILTNIVVEFLVHKFQDAMANDRRSEAYSMPDEYASLDELAAPAPVEDSQKKNLKSHETTRQSSSEGPSRKGRKNSAHHVRQLSSDNYDIPDDFTNLDELASPSPVQNPHERHLYSAEYLEEQRSQEQAYERNAEQEVVDGSDHQVTGNESRTNTPTSRASPASRFATELYTLSYLISFSILGTLARLGLQALTAYPGSPVTTSELWANVGGSIIMGFLSEDKNLFQDHGEKRETEGEKRDDSDGSQETVGTILQADIPRPEDPEMGKIEVQKTHNAMKKTIPLYIGLTTGFCGSFTSFSSFLRDIFLQLANQPPAIQPSSASKSAIPRNGGYSFMAVLAVIILTVCLCLSALKAGAHLAIGLENITPSLPTFLTRKAFDRSAATFAWAVWLGSIFLAIWPPDRPLGPVAPSSMSWAQETWRGRVLFSLVFAPLGCILRFYASIRLNGIISSFPLGTFIVNISGTAILGICWDLQHAPLSVAGGSIGGGQLGCQVLQGVQDGFCGCLTTISTWVLEIMGLRRKHAYLYGGISMSVGLAFLVVIMGSLVWSRGISATSCAT